MGRFEHLMEILGDEGDIELFSTDAVNILTRFKWDTYASKIHTFSSSVFSIYLVTYFIFINLKYNKHKWYGEEDEARNYYPMCYIMLACNTVACIYDTRQFINIGIIYVFDAWNYVDWVFIISGYYNIFNQLDPMNR